MTIPPRLSINATGHVTQAQGRTLTIPDAPATQDSDGLMSAADKAKLDGISPGGGAVTDFLAAHPVGSVVEAESDPGVTYGGAWSVQPGNMGCARWKRTA